MTDKLETEIKINNAFKIDQARQLLEALVRDRAKLLDEKKVLMAAYKDKLDNNDDAIINCLFEIDGLCQVLPLFPEAEEARRDR